MKLFLLVTVAVTFGAPVSAAQPDFQNAKVTREAAQPNLLAQITGLVQSGNTAWIGYEVESIGRARNSSDVCTGMHYLEDNDRNYGTSGDRRSMAILLRTGNRTITRGDLVPTDCHIDAGGLPVQWLTGLSAEQSVKMLDGLLASSYATRKLDDVLLLAISVHDTPLATEVLSRAATNSGNVHLREQAAFWLGVQRGHEGLTALKELAKDSDPEFRKKLTFDISQNADPESVSELIRMARNDSAPEVRGQAIFWLAQKAGKKQAGTIADMAGDDPDRGVKKKAVFALTQLPADESYQQLVKVAETNRDAAIRKDAIFWLGQSKDPRALEYLEKILRQ
jgi:HEAT repeat protein